MKRFQYFHTVCVRAEAWAEDEKEARERVAEALITGVNRYVPMLWFARVRGRDGRDFEPLVVHDTRPEP